MKRKNTHGFTLIELSIVLVIIGLITGGVLVGRDLIEAAQVRATVSQMEQFDAATNTFKLKYNCLPGDCANPENVGFSPNAHGTNLGDPNGNGIIAELEVGDFFYHLGAAKLIAGEYVSGGTYPGLTTPKTKVKLRDLTGFSIWCNDRSSPQNTPYNDIQLSNAFSIQNNDVSSAGAQPALTAPIAYALDAKIDDGLPTTGKFRSFGASGGGTGAYVGTGSLCGNRPHTQFIAPAGNGTRCINGATNPMTYNMAGAEFACLSINKSSF